MTRWLVAAVMVAVLAAGAGPSLGQVIPLLDPNTIVKFQDPLYQLTNNMAVPNGTYNGVPLYDIDINQFTWNFSSQGALAGGTTVWGYGIKKPDGSIQYSMPGPTMVTTAGQTVAFRYTNNLRDANGAPLPNLLPVDPTLMGMRDMAGTLLPTNRTVVHRHGGHQSGSVDGNPWQEFGSDPAGPSYRMSPSGVPSPAGNSVIYEYPSNQEASLIWYHDHAFGLTHLNPYAGMAAGWVITDSYEQSLGLPSRMVPLVLQDKQFTATGQLFYPRGPGDLETPGGADPIGPTLRAAGYTDNVSTVPEAFGDFITVNGTVWPYMDAEATLYRFRLLDGANSRTFKLQASLADGTVLPWRIIGSDGGLLPATVLRSALTIMPGERYDAVLDFSSLPTGTLVTLRNLGPEGPFMNNDPMQAPAADPNGTGLVMQFRIGPVMGGPAGVVPANPRPITRLDPNGAAGTRIITMTEEVDMYGRLEIMLNQTPFDAAPTEIVQLNDMEVWTFINMTPDVHPMHLHDVMFQIIGRRALAVDANTGLFLPFADPTAPLLPPDATEMGWKDTFQTFPGYSNEIIALFADYIGDYVYHCHILEHEEFDMMRPFQVVPEPLTMATVAIGGLLLLKRRRARKI